MEKVQLAGEGILLRTYEMKDVEQPHSAAWNLWENFHHGCRGVTMITMPKKVEDG